MQNIQKVAFTGGIGTFNSYDNILKYCDRLKSLKISDWNTSTANFPRNNYPTLEHFECDLDSKSKAAVFGDFLQANHNIKSIACRFLFHNRSKVNILRSIFQKAPHIETAFIDYGKLREDFAPLASTLSDERIKLKELHLKLTTIERCLNKLEALSSLRCLTGLHISGAVWTQSTS